MCYAKPGPRCSGHARKTLTSKEERLQKATEEVRSLKKDYEANPGDADLKKQTAQAAHRYRTAKTEFVLAQRDYDGTPAGRKELEAKLLGKCSGKQRKEFTKRLQSGKMMYSWRKHQLDMKKMEKSTGLSLKQRRGSFLTNPGGAALAA